MFLRTVMNMQIEHFKGKRHWGRVPEGVIFTQSTADKIKYSLASPHIQIIVNEAWLPLLSIGESFTPAGRAFPRVWSYGQATTLL